MIEIVHFDFNFATYDVLRLVGPNLVDEVETHIDKRQSPGRELLFHLQPCSCTKERGIGANLCLT